MNSDFLAKLSAATDQLRLRDVTGATQAIQSALNALPDASPPNSGEVARFSTLSEHTRGLSDPTTMAGQRPRRRLADVVKLIPKFDTGRMRQAAALGRGARARQYIADPLPPGASFTQHSYSCRAGTREYKLCKPSANFGHSRALIVMLHGCTQNAVDFSIGTRMNRLAHEHGVLIVYPEQSPTANQLKCWNWFNPRDQQRDAGEPAMIAGLTRELVREHGIDVSQVYVAGLSSGGAMAVILGAVYPDIFSAVGVHSGLPLAAAHDVPSAFEAMRSGHYTTPGGPTSRNKTPSGTAPRIIIFHGDADSTVHPANGVALFERACKSEGLLTTTRHDGEGDKRQTIRVGSTRDGKIMAELWEVHGSGHAWSGGDPRGTFVDPSGPSASREMLRFFLK